MRIGIKKLKRMFALLTACVLLHTAAFAEAAFKSVVLVYDMTPETVTDADGNEKTYYPVCVYGAIDSLDYDEVGFDISASTAGGSETRCEKTTEVFESMTVVTAEGGETRYTAEDLGGKYMFGSKLLFNSESFKNSLTELSIVPYAIRGGEKISDGGTKVSDKTIKEIDPSASLFHEEKKFVTVFENTEKYLYRVGNANEVKLGSLFNLADGKSVDNSCVALELTEEIAGNVTMTFTPDTEDFANSAVRFSGSGVVRLEISAASAATELCLEVVDGYNVTSFSELKNNKNNVLLCNIAIQSGGWSYSGGTLFGNGFDFDVTKGTTSAHYIISLKDAVLDNVRILGAVYKSYASSQSDDYYSSAIQSYGESRITNCFVSNCRSPIRINSGELEIENSVLFGGRYASLNIMGGSVTLRNSTTVNMPNEGVLGLGIVFDSDASEGKLTVVGDLTQYNWVKESDKSCVPSSLENMFKSMFSDSAYSSLRYSFDGTEYINTGILSLSENITPDDVRGLGDSYQYVKNGTAFVYSVKSESAGKLFENGVPKYSESDHAAAQGVRATLLIRTLFRLQSSAMTFP